ncbi:MAG TPA: PLP-dependent aminotransferase family protein [Vicinamibacterales bacterium]|nr:PLP-dependent aminotransferase family protein [Vicinamibacterales bacterium]
MTDYDRFFSLAGRALRESAIRKMGTVLAASREVISFAPGYPATESFAWDDFRAIADDLLTRRPPDLLQYGPTRGYRPLVDAILDIQKSRGMDASVPQVIVTTGSQQGLYLIARALFDPGDVVLVELPSYTGAISAFRGFGADLTGVRQDADGIDLEDLDRTTARVRAEGKRVKALYLVPNFQNPTGLLISLEKRRALVDWAEREDVLIVEDDPYRDIYFPDVTREEETRPIAADDPNGRVMYLSSFSKTLAPGFRTAWIVAPAPVAAKLELAKQPIDLCTSALDQQMVYEACARGVLAAQAPKLRALYQRKRDVMVAAIHEHASDLSGPDPRGGFFLWARLPEGLNADSLLTRATAEGVIYVTGTAFFVDGTGDTYIRLSFSSPSEERIKEGVARLGRAMNLEREERKVPRVPRVPLVP